MSGYEEQLHARAEMLDETGELAAAVTAILAGASGAGVDPRAIVSLRAAIAALDPAGGAARLPGRQPHRPAPRQRVRVRQRVPGGGQRRRRPDRRLAPRREPAPEQVIAALDKAHADRERAQRDLEAARQDLAAAYAMATTKDCDGCHGRKAAAITAAEAAIAGAEERIRDATRRIGICEDTAEILDPLTRRLHAALHALRQVPHDLGEVYELIYQFIRRGGKMPRLGRWIEGAPA